VTGRGGALIDRSPEHNNSLSRATKRRMPTFCSFWHAGKLHTMSILIQLASQTAQNNLSLSIPGPPQWRPCGHEYFRAIAIVCSARIPVVQGHAPDHAATTVPAERRIAFTVQRASLPIVATIYSGGDGECDTNILVNTPFVPPVRVPGLDTQQKQH
jgi:hypothetical protein